MTAFSIPTLISAVLTSLVLSGAPVGAGQRPAAAPQPAAAADPDVLLAKAVQLHEAGDLLGAVASYEAALAVQPDNPGVHSNLGAALVRLGRHDEGIAHYRRALALAPGEVSFRFNLALALYKSGESTAAASELEGVLAAQKDHLSARLLLGDCYLRMGRFQDVVDVLAPWEAEFGDDKGFGYVLGSAFVETDRPEHAQRVMDRIFAGQSSAEAHLVMATAHLRSGDANAALAELKQAMTINPRLPTLNALMGRALMRSGDTDAALRAFQRELEINPNDFQSNLEVAELKKRQQQFEDAEIYTRRALKMRPRDPGARFSLAGIYVSTGKPDEARQVLESVVADAPTYAEAHVLLATVYYRLQRKEDGDRMRAVVERLNADAQKRNLLAKP